MDMFISCIDIHLQPPDVYKRLLARDDGDSGAISYLNRLINVATKVVRESQDIPSGVEYTEYINVLKFSEGTKKLIKDCDVAIATIEDFAKGFTGKNFEDVNIFDALSDEIDYGLNRYMNVSSASKPSETHDPSVTLHGTDTTISQVDTSIPARSAEMLKASKGVIVDEQYYAYSNAILNDFTLKLDLKNYSRYDRGPKLAWKRYFSGCSTRLLSRNNFKFNSIQPEVTINEDETTHIDSFTPVIYPDARIAHNAPELFAKPVNKTHPYSSELHALDWNDEDDTHSHKGSKILGAGTLFKVTPSFNKVNMGYTLVEDEPGLMSMIEELKRSSIVAIDVEHYSSGSSCSFVCLVQFSTIDTNWIVDPFNIFDLMSNLNVITTDPKILKIMHGADNDIIWLQRDFNIYIVNMFDTLRAAKLLHVDGGHSLASLLKTFCNVRVNKSYRLGDWRIRPLPQDMLNYASGDTHYLFELYNILKNMALGTDDGLEMVRQIMLSSRKVCLKCYNANPFKILKEAKYICKRAQVSLFSLDHISYNYLLNLIAFRRYASKTLQEPEDTILPDHSIIENALHAKPEIPYFIKLRNVRFNFYCFHSRISQTIIKALDPEHLPVVAPVRLEHLLQSPVRMDTLEAVLSIYDGFASDGAFNVCADSLPPELMEAIQDGSLSAKHGLPAECDEYTSKRRNTTN